MNAALRTLSLALVTPFFAVACTAGSSEPSGSAERTADSELPLVGGRLAQPGEYASTVEVAQNCTGTKVGPRHFLVAAHCVHDTSANGLQWQYLPGAKVRISGAKVASFASYQELTVEETTIFPAWLSACIAPCPLPILTPTHPPDVAVIVVKEETPSIPAAEIDPSPVRVGDAVVVAGFGCENGLYKTFGPDTREAKIDATHALAKDALVHAGSFVAASDAAAIAASYVVTPGHASGEAEASLCFGDSGGPLYRGDTTSLLVVGINAYYTFPEPFDGVSQTNWHTRVDTQAPGNVTSWLEGRGAAIHRAAVAPVPTPVPRVALTHVLEAEDYARTGEGVGFQDSDAKNEGGAYRNDGVDIERASDDGGGYDVGWTAAGEWLAFDVTAESDDVFDVSVRVASPNSGKSLHVEVDGRNVTRALAVPNTGGWQAYTTVTARGIAVTKGDHTVRVVFDTDGVNLNWLAFTPEGSGTKGRVEAKPVSPVTPEKPVVVTASPTPASPCDGLCATPKPFDTASYSASNLGSGASCFETRAKLSGIACGNVVAPRAFAINGTAEACGGASITLPAARNGGYCIVAGAGEAPWAWFSTW